MNKKSNYINDHYSHKAQLSGFPARSIFKLESLNKKYNLLKSKMRILDLGAAPGSWSLFALKEVGKAGSVIAVDTKPLSEEIMTISDQLHFIQSDFSSEEFFSNLTNQYFDTILSDASPKTSGNRHIDATNSADLVEIVLKITLKSLKPTGNLVAKILQGPELPCILKYIKQYFGKVKTVKPVSSRPSSTETFIVALGKYA